MSLVTIVVLVAALHLGRELLIPFAMAFLLAPTLVAPVVWLQRCRLGRVPAVAVVILVVCAVLGVTTWFLAQQVTDLVARLPEYQEQILTKIGSLRGGMLEKANDAVNELAAGIETTAPAGPPAAPPQDVRVVMPARNAFEVLASGLGLLFGPMGTLAVVLLLVAFLLLQRGDLRDRIVHLIGDGRVNLTTQAMSEITTRVSRYLRMQVLLNLLHGTVVGLGLLAFGVPNALVWGLLAMMLRFVPYAGPIVASVLPVALALAVFDGWQRPLLIAGFLVGIEGISNNLLEPWLYGKSSGVSALAVIASAVFWAWLWGPIGIVLATPLTVALVVIGRHVPRLHFLAVLLGEEPSIDPGVRVYQRLLAMDRVDLVDITERMLAEQKSFVRVCDTVLIPALAMAEFDRHHGNLPDAHAQFIGAAMRDLVESLAEQDRALQAAVAPAGPAPAAESTAPAFTPVRVMCIPARNGLDQVVGLMLCQALGDTGAHCRIAAIETLESEAGDGVDGHRPDVVCISALPPSGSAQIRYLARRLRVRFPQLPIVVALWGGGAATDEGARSLQITGPCWFTTTLVAAIEQIRRLVDPALPGHRVDVAAATSSCR